MAINGVLNFKDKNGDITTVYPVTSAENVAGLSAALASKVDKEAGKGLSANDYTTTEKEKLAGIEAGANAYTLPAATSSTLGGVKQGANITIAADGTISTANYTLPKATTTSLGGIQVGTDLNIDSSTGSLSVNKTSSVTSGSGELVTSGGVYAALENKVDKVAGKGLSSNDYSDNEKNKLSGIEAGAEVNVQADWNQTTSTADDYIKNKPTLGTAAAASASDFATAAQGTKADNAIPSSEKGTANGVAELDSNGLVPASQLPSFVDDVLEYASVSGFPETGETGKIYVDKSDNKTYRWSGSTYVEISSSLALGTTSSTAFRGDRGQTAYEHATDASRLTTAKTSGLYKIATTAEGHVASATPVTKSDITALGIPAQDTTYSEATTSASGLMSASDKSKLNGIEAQANKTVVDSALSSTSTNPLQNKVINTAITQNKTFITPEQFGAIGDGVTDDSDAVKDAIDYGYANNMPVFIKNAKITKAVRFRGDISGGVLKLTDSAHIIVSSDNERQNNVHNLIFDVTDFSGTALEIKSNHTNVTKCSFKGHLTNETIVSDVVCILVKPFIRDEEPFYVNTYKGLWGVHIENNFFYGVQKCISIESPDDKDAWISDVSIIRNSGFYHYCSISIDGQHDHVNNISYIKMYGNAFSDNFTVQTERFGLKIHNANGTISSIDNAFFSDGDDTNYYGFFVENNMRTRNAVQEGDWLYSLIRSRFGILYRNHSTDGKDHIIQGMTQRIYSSNMPSLKGIAKNLLYNANIEDVPSDITYQDNTIVYNNSGTSNAQVSIPIPSEMNNTNGYFGYLAVCDFNIDFTIGNRVDIPIVDGNLVRSSEAIPWPGSKRSGNISGGFNQINNEFKNTLKLRFQDFPRGTFTVKALIVFTEYVSNVNLFTDDFSDLSMFNY